MHVHARYATILAFDVPVTKEAGDQAKELNVTIFTAEIIYHLFDKFTAYMADVRKAQQEAWLESVRAERREEKAIIKAALEDVKGQRERAAMRASPLFVCVVCGQQKKAGSCSSCRMKPDKSDRRALATTARGAVFLSSPPTPNMLFLRDIEQPKWKNGRLAGQFS